MFRAMMAVTVMSLFLRMALLEVGLVRFMAVVAIDDVRRDVAMEEAGDEADAG